MSERSPSVDDEAFDYHQRKNGTVVISYYGSAVTNLSGKEATKLTRRVEALEGRGQHWTLSRLIA